MDKIKEFGEVYTPLDTIKEILDNANYVGNKVLKKHVLDPSAGDGEFILEFITRYVNAFRSKPGYSKKSEKKLVTELETYIHGIEIQKKVILKMNEKIDKLSKKLDLFKTPIITISNENTLNFNFKNPEIKMDFIFGNPPYVRRKNISKESLESDTVTKYHLNGNFDLYIAFFLKSLELLKQDGILGFITPNSFFTIDSAKILRKEILNNCEILKIINLGHYNPFKGKALTYTAITILKKNPASNSEISYKRSDENKFRQVKLQISNSTNFYFDVPDEFLNILNYSGDKLFCVKNGAASNGDWFFYNDDFSGPLIKNAIKASTMRETKAFFPYDDDGHVLTIDEIKLKNPELHEKLEKNRERLSSRSLQRREWYEFARSQGIKDFVRNDVYTLVINNLLKENDNLKIKIFDKGNQNVVFSGYYIQSDSRAQLEKISQYLLGTEFLDFISKLNKYKSGGYFSFSSKELENYLNYKIDGNTITHG